MKLTEVFNEKTVQHLNNIQKARVYEFILEAKRCMVIPNSVNENRILGWLDIWYTLTSSIWRRLDIWTRALHSTTSATINITPRLKFKWTKMKQAKRAYEKVGGTYPPV